MFDNEFVGAMEVQLKHHGKFSQVMMLMYWLMIKSEVSGTCHSLPSNDHN
jgi:hypothetical protein